MRTVISIEHLEFFIGKDKKKHCRTYALLDDGTECQGYGKNYQVGDKVMVFYHKDIIKMSKPA